MPSEAMWAIIIILIGAIIMLGLSATTGLVIDVTDLNISDPTESLPASNITGNGDPGFFPDGQYGFNENSTICLSESCTKNITSNETCAIIQMVDTRLEVCE